MSRGGITEEENHDRVDVPSHHPMPDPLVNWSDNDLLETKQFLQRDDDGAAGFIPDENGSMMEVGSDDFAHPYAALRHVGTSNEYPLPHGISMEEVEDHEEAADKIYSDGVKEDLDEDMEDADVDLQDSEEKDSDTEYTEDLQTDHESDDAPETETESNEDEDDTGHAAAAATPYRDEDVLMGRGGRSNQHPGNKLYLEDKEKLRERYVLASSKAEKTLLSKELVAKVHYRGGRFVRKVEDTEDWVEVGDEVARKKASQSLRESSSAESRRLKRLKYGNSKKRSRRR